jgi:hypothetical protein
MTTESPATPAATPPATTPGAQPAEKTEVDYKDLGIKAAGLLVAIITTFVGTLTYIRAGSLPASQVLGSVEVHPFYVPRPFDVRKHDPSFPVPTKGEKIDPDSAQFDFAKKQYTVTVSNRGSKEATNVRLLVPQGADFYVNASKPEIPGPVTLISDSKIELHNLEINESRKIYVWSSEPITNAEAETITIAHEGGKRDVKPLSPSTFPWYMTPLAIGAFFGLIAATIHELKTARKFSKATEDLREKASEAKALMEESKQATEQAEEAMKEIRTQQAATIDLQRRVAESFDEVKETLKEAKNERDDLVRLVKEAQEQKLKADALIEDATKLASKS